MLCLQGVEESYDAAVTEYFQPYHSFVDKLLRFGFNQDEVPDHVIACSKCCSYYMPSRAIMGLWLLMPLPVVSTVNN